jgi:hypothetical protein
MALPSPVADMFEPGTVLPAQLFPSTRAAMQPERRLMLAILEDAVATAERYGRARFRGRRAQVEARVWILSDDVRWPFSFVNVCDTLGLDPRCLRRGLAKLVARAGDRSEPAKPVRLAMRRMSGSRTRVTLPPARRSLDAGVD